MTRAKGSEGHHTLFMFPSPPPSGHWGSLHQSGHRHLGPVSGAGSEPREDSWRLGGEGPGTLPLLSQPQDPHQIRVCWVSSPCFLLPLPSRRYLHFCGGAAVTTSAILTAAHCVQTTPRSSLYVSIGEHDINSVGENERLIKVSDIVT